MDVIFPISVAPIEELDEISLKSERYQRGVWGSKNYVHWTLSVAVIYIWLSPKYLKISTKSELVFFICALYNRLHQSTQIHTMVKMLLYLLLTLAEQQRKHQKWVSIEELISKCLNTFRLYPKMTENCWKSKIPKRPVRFWLKIEGRTRCTHSFCPKPTGNAFISTF